MSKSTKIIAALGVAAGLGVAALPAATFAATSVVTPLKVIVEPVISLEGTNAGDLVNGTGLTLAAGANNAASTTALTAKSNNSGGWVVTVAATAETNGRTLKNAANDTIAPFASPVSDITTSTTTGWGIQLSGAGANDTYLKVEDHESAFTTSSFTGVTEDDLVVYASSAPSPNAGVGITATYGISLADGQAAGTYEGSITYSIVDL